MSGVGDVLWNSEVGPADYRGAGEHYRTAVLEQYKLCVEMADRISARRNLANTFFLSLNSAVVVLLATAAGKEVRAISNWVLFLGFLILFSQCASWFVMVRSYRQLNAAKYEVIGSLEARLPAYAYSRAEWQSLGEGRDWRKYMPLTHVEQWVPVTFGTAYLLGFLVLAL